MEFWARTLSAFLLSATHCYGAGLRSYYNFSIFANSLYASGEVLAWLFSNRIADAMGGNMPVFSPLSSSPITSMFRFRQSRIHFMTDLSVSTSPSSTSTSSPLSAALINALSSFKSLLIRYTR